MSVGAGEGLGRKSPFQRLNPSVPNTPPQWRRASLAAALQAAAELRPAYFLSVFTKA